ncbi:MAG: AAA family ATPase [Desulfomonilaceae bacterium]
MNFATRITISNFTAFRRLKLDFSRGLNIIIGENSTGKTHLLKLLYAALNVTQPPLQGRKAAFPLKVLRVFMPERSKIGHLVRFGSARTRVEVLRDCSRIAMTFGKANRGVFSDRNMVEENWFSHPVESVFIPPKEMLAHAPGFASLSETRRLHFEEIYPDLIRKAYLPALRKEHLSHSFAFILKKIASIVGGEIIEKESQFFLKGENDLEFPLLAEGLRKFGLLWLLIRNGVISGNSVLLWDEPEANLNPSLVGQLTEILLELQRAGVQICISTHNYVVLKEFELRRKSEDQMRFFSLFKKDNQIAAAVSDDLDSLDPNLILETIVSLYDRDVEKILRKGERG